MRLHILTLIALFSSLAFSEIDPDMVFIAIDCGNKSPYTTENGLRYKAVKFNLWGSFFRINTLLVGDRFPTAWGIKWSNTRKTKSSFKPKDIAMMISFTKFPWKPMDFMYWSLSLRKCTGMYPIRESLTSYWGRWRWNRMWIWWKKQESLEHTKSILSWS